MLNNFFTKIYSNTTIRILFILLCFVLPYKMNAASLSLLPSPANVSVGNILSLKVIVNTESKSINNADATIQFPVDLLEVVSITKSSSIFSLWVEEPKFSNITGKITFNGGVPNPGYIGQSGNLVSITFRAKKQGTASILILNGAVRENDGLGTDILTYKSGSVIQIVSTPKEVKIPTKTEEVKKITTISSFTPTIRFDDIQGILRLQEENKIDDNIDYYTILIDDANSLKVQTNQLINGEYYLPLQNEGTHSISIVYFSKTGEYKENTFNFVSPSISIPILSLNSYEITKNNFVIIEGKTNYPNSKVIVVLELEGNEIHKYTQITREDGSFSITTDNLIEPGIVSIWAESILSENFKSSPSEKIYLKINDTAVMRVTFSVLYPLLYLIIIFIIVSLIFVFIYLGWHKFFNLKKKYTSESKEAILEIHKNMLSLKTELRYQLESLEKIKIERNLNKEEEIIFNELEKKVDMVDSFIENKLKKLI